MAEIKRPNSFTTQFLVEKDFDDEQAYHRDSRRRHNRVSHTIGVADGFAVTLTSGRTVQVGAGTAIDKDGREIVVNDPVTYTLGTGAEMPNRGIHGWTKTRAASPAMTLPRQIENLL